MKIVFAPRESDPRETRAALTPDLVKKLTKLGLTVKVESDIGARAAIPDKAYEDAGAEVLTDRDTAQNEADIVLRVRKPSTEDLAQLKPGALHASFLDPFNEKELLDAIASKGVNAVSMEMIPRTTLAQKMDALSSQANLAGYAAVVMAADRMQKILPMMMTPAGTLSPAHFFIIGVGVAGLQAIATAKRLGARVEAFDTRPVVEEQVKSLGAKFVKVNLGYTGQTDQGYAKELTPEMLEKQRQGMAKACSQADVVITTAKLFGRPAPKVITHDILTQMKSGSIIVDLAVETGGNVEGSKLGEDVVTENGVHVIGHENIEGYYANHASQMLASNFYNFIEHFWDAEAGDFRYDLDDEILKGCLLTRNGAIIHDKFKSQ